MYSFLGCNLQIIVYGLATFCKGEQSNM